MEEKIPLTSKEEVERKLGAILTQVQQNQIRHLNLTSASLGRFYELANTLMGHKNAVYSLAVLKNGALASSSGDCTIKIWDLASNSCPSTLQGHTSVVWILAALPNDQLASGSYDKTIKLWDLASNSYLSTLQEQVSHVSALSVIPSGQLAIGSWGNTIKLWDLASKSCFSALQGHSGPVWALAALPNHHLASGSQDGTIKLWDLTSHSCLSTLKGHINEVNALVALPNGLLASGSQDETIKIWDLTSHSCLTTLKGHTDSVEALTAFPDGLIASGSSDKTIKLWKSKMLAAQHLQPILSALKNNTTVTNLDLSVNRDILDDLIDPLISIFTPDTSFSLKPNTSLKTIDLRKTGISKRGVRKLEKAIQHQGLPIEVLADCPVEWMMIYFLIIFCRANRNSPFADSGLDLCKHGEIGPFLDVSSGFFARTRNNPSSSEYVTPSSSSPS